MINNRIYIALALIGFLLPWSQYVSFLQTEGLDLPLFFSHVYANAPMRGFTLDLLWATLVFWIWSFYDSRQNNIPHWWSAFLAGACIGLSVALPLYLVFRSIKLAPTTFGTKSHSKDVH